LLELINTSKEELIEDAGFNTDTYEVVGSIYLAQPNTEWRGKELIDRKDF